MKVNQIIIKEMATTSGAVASVAKPMGETQKRPNVRGLTPAEKVLSGKAKKQGPYANSLSEGKMEDLSMDLKGGKDGLNDADFKKKYGKSKQEMRKSLQDKPKSDKPVQEAKLDEDDLILIPGQGGKRKTGFVPHGQSRVDHEVEMARSDVLATIKNAKAIYELLRDRSEDEGLEGWVQEKLIKANDYLNSVKEYYDEKNIHQEMSGGVIAGGGVGESSNKLQGTPVASLSDYTDKDSTKNKYGQTVPKKLKPNDPRVKFHKEPQKQGVAEGGILKSIKRGLQGWDKNAVGPGGEKLGNPRDIVKRAKAMDTDTAKKVRSGLDAASDHSPAGLQKRVLDRKLKDVSEGSENLSYKKGWKLCDKDPSADPQHLFRRHGEGLDRNQFIKGFNDNAKSRGMSIYGDVSGDVDHSTLRYKEFKRDQGVAEGFSDIVKGIKRKVAGKEDPKEVEHMYGRIARSAIKHKTPDQAEKDIERYNRVSKIVNKEGVAEGSGPQLGDEVYYGNRLVGWFKGYSKFGKIITEPNVDEMGDEYLSKDAYWDPQPKITIKPKKGVAEGAKVDRMVQHIKKSEIKTGKSKDEAEDIAWATVNKRGYLDNKNKKAK